MKIPFPTSPSDGQIYTNPVGTKYKYVAAENKWQVVGGPTYAEVSSASNEGAGGVGVFKQKTLGNLEFKNINAGSSKISVTDDTGNDEVDIDVVEAQIDHDSLNGLTANNHHSQVHELNGPDHATTTPLDWSKVNKTGSNLNELTTRNHSDLTDDEIAQHRIINDAGVSLTELWSSSKIDTTKRDKTKACEWVPAAYNGNYGHYAVLSVGGNAGDVFTFRIPKNFASLTSAYLYFIPTNTSTTSYDLDSHYGKLGEPYNQHTQQALAVPFSQVTDQIMRIDLSPVLTNIQADDFVGVEIGLNAWGATVHFLGTLLEYTEA